MNIMWTEDEVKKLHDGRKRNLSISDLSIEIGKSEAAIRVYMTRHNIPVKRVLDCPIVEKLINIKFADAKWFRPNRDFFSKVKISQKRFSDLRHGYANPTEDEMKRIASVLSIGTDDLLALFKSRQLNLFDQSPT